MDAFLLIILFIIIFIVFPVGIIYLIYAIPKNLGYPKVGKFIAVTFAISVTIVIIMSVFEDQFFTKNDAKELLSEQEITLNDEIEIQNNESSWAIGDYYHSFSLLISENDKRKTINQIKKSKNFKEVNSKIKDLLHESNRYSGPKQIQNYETEYSFVREFFQPNGQGYAPTFRRIIIDKKENKLTFVDINE